MKIDFKNYFTIVMFDKKTFGYAGDCFSNTPLLFKTKKEAKKAIKDNRLKGVKIKQSTLVTLLEVEKGVVNIKVKYNKLK